MKRVTDPKGGGKKKEGFPTCFCWLMEEKKKGGRSPRNETPQNRKGKRRGGVGKGIYLLAPIRAEEDKGPLLVKVQKKGKKKKKNHAGPHFAACKKKVEKEKGGTTAPPTERKKKAELQ